ncbi:satellite-binding protein 1 Dp1 [Rhipicephalus microplus]|uniref:satellite-binding protein 1 Dp1 n=1 Tax=Rhipicephalus microplus TaxID=6941 RepID=UPI001886B111|nr:vigilin-like [Rhipicephalus microplus]
MNADLQQQPAEGAVAGPPSSTAPPAASVGFSYDEVFPALPEKEAPVEAGSATGSVGGGGGGGALGQWNHKMHVKSSVITQIFHVPSEERRFRETSSQRFGELGEQAKICADIMRDTQTTIEVSSSRDHSLTVLVTGRERNVALARAHVLRALQTQAQGTIQIPKEHHRFILGKNGKKLAELEQNTATKITVPRTDDNSDVITISGTKEAIDRARDHIQKISEEKSKHGVEELKIPRMYHPFIAGPYNNSVKALEQETGTRIRLDREEDKVTITGDKENVAKAKDALMATYEDRKLHCQSVGVEVKKSQHKYVHGYRGQTLQELFEQTGVWVEVPPMESDVETITLRGNPQDLGHALSLVYEKANSVLTAEVPAKSWMHKYIIGKKGENIKRITADYHKTHVDFCEDENMIRIEGPKEELEAVKTALEEKVREIQSTMDSVEIKVDPQYHRHIIGKAGSNVNRLKQDLGVTVHVPADEERSPVVRLEGPPEGVAQAKTELLEMAHKLQNEVTRELCVEQRFHRTLIGAKGEAIQDVRRRFNQVNVTFPEPGSRNDKVLIRGPKEDVDACYRHMSQICQELQASSHRVDLVLFKQFLKHLQGKGRSLVRRIQQETEARIDLPLESSNSDVVMITGKKENVAAAKDKLLEAQREQADVVEVHLMIPCNLHNAIIGAKGRLIHSIMEDCGRVQITFPQQDSKSDRVTLSGPKEDVDKAKKQLLNLSNEKQLSSYTEEVRAQPKHHRFLIGKNGSNIRKVREKTGARIIFPTDRDENQDTIVIIGKKEAVLDAKKQLEEMIESLEKVVEEEMRIDPKYHRHFVARRGEELQHIANEFGGVQVSFPRSGDHSDVVTLKGAKECVEGARKRILEIVQDLEARVTIECVIPQQHHRTIMGAKGHKVQRINQEFNVHIKFPERDFRERETLENGDVAVNGDVATEEEPSKPRKEDLIFITGKQEDCEKAREALLALVPVSLEVEVPFKLHRFIIGQKGAGVRRLMEDHDVNITVPPQADESDTLVISGLADNVASAKEALLERVSQILEEEEDRKARSFHLDVEVDSKYHPKIIGWRGAVVTKIRKDHNVQVQFPEKGENMITIIGYEKNACSARDEILRIVKEWEDMVTKEIEIDHRVHSRLIGAKGRNIRRLMEQHKVEIKFPRPEDPNKDLVQVTGAEEDVEDALDYLKQFEDEHLEDIMDQESYQPASRQGQNSGGGSGNNAQGWTEQSPSSEGFVVRGGPWEQRAPDTTSTQEFPSFGGGPPIDSVPAKPVPWGPSRR